MVYQQILSPREKVLAVIAGVLLVVLAGVGYVQASSVFIAQEEAKDDSRNQQNQIKDQLNYLKNLKSEVSRAKKDVKPPATIDTAKIDGFLLQFEVCLNLRQAEIGTQDFWNNMQDCDSVKRDAESELNDYIRPAVNCSNNRRNIEDKKKERKNLDSQLKDILRNDKAADVSALKALMSQIDAQFAAYAALGQSCDSASADTLNDIQNELNAIFQDFYSASNEVRDSANTARRKTDNQKDFDKNIKRGCEKDKAREFKNYEKQFLKLQKTGGTDADSESAYANVKELYNNMCVTLFGAMQAALASGDMDAFESSRQDFWDSDRGFWDILNESRQGVEETRNKAEQIKNITRDLQQKTKDLTRMKRDLDRMKRTYNRTARKYADAADRKETVAAFGAFVSQAEDLIAKIEAGLAAAVEEAKQDPESYWIDRNEELQDMQNEFNDLQQEVQRIANILRTLKDAEKEINKNTPRELEGLKEESNNDPELIPALENLLSRARESLKQAWTYVLTSPDDAEAALQSLQGIGEDWDETVNDWRESRVGAE